METQTRLFLSTLIRLTHKNTLSCKDLDMASELRENFVDLLINFEQETGETHPLDSQLPYIDIHLDTLT